MTEGIESTTVTAWLWISNRNFENLNLVASIDGTSASVPIRQSLDQYFGALGGVSHDELRAEGRSPDISSRKKSLPRAYIHGRLLRHRARLPAIIYY